MADIILDRQRDYPADVGHYPVAFICSNILSITVGQIVKTKVRVNLKYNKIIIIFYLVH